MINLPFSVGAMLDREREQLNYEIRRELFEKVALAALSHTPAESIDSLLEIARTRTTAILKAADEFAKKEPPK